MDEAQSSGRGAVRSSVRFRITALATLVFVGVLTVTAVALVVVQTRSLTSNIDASLQLRADDLEAVLLSGGMPATLGLGADEAFVQLVAEDGAVQASSANLVGEPPVVPTGGIDSLQTVSVDQLDDDPFRVLTRTIQLPSGSLVLHIGATIDDVRDSTAALGRSLAVAIPVVAAVLAALTWWLVGRALHPVEAIRAEVATISGTALQRRVPQPPGDDEIARLAATMNDMLGRIEASSRRQQRFVADASHELRSPLTRIKSEVEVDLAHPQAADYVATHRSVVEEAASLGRLVDDLLYLARADAGEMQSAGEVVAVGELVERQVGQAAVTSQVPIEMSGDDAAAVMGNYDQIARVVRNLLDNAIRHAATRVVVTLALERGDVVVAVEDDGPGIPADQRKRVFDRFARIDEARSAAEGGTGLGLAIAREIVDRHGGSISVDPDITTGARFVVRLPAVERP